LVEQYQSLNIKTAILGQDKHMNEYWFFKDDMGRIFIKYFETDEDGLRWGFIDEDEQLDVLMESLNIKGIREKKLQENLRKLRIQIKMKKAKKPKTDEATNNQEDEEMFDEEKDNNNDATEETKGKRHHLFQNDSYE
jgi:hypothetical protein